MRDDVVTAGMYFDRQPSCAALHAWGAALALKADADEIWEARRRELLPHAERFQALLEARA